MARITKQIKEWSGIFGKEYTDRCSIAVEELDEIYKRDYGITRTELNQEFIGSLSRDVKILEVGTNIGLQLSLLQEMGFKNLYGIEINDYAIEIFKSRTKNINIIRASALDIPFKDGYFDLVFTAGLLIHISPSDINMVMQEIYRCARNYIWGVEYYADQYTEVVYRGKKDLLWKTNFPKLYIDSFAGLKLVQEKKMPYLYNDNIDVMFLLKKDKCKE